MPALAQTTESSAPSHSITKISANARIDYILRFSKQAVLVVDHQLAHCSTVASQFLSTLPGDHNAAFISVSAKLNNIQVRCRLIEQLFRDELFDPEQSIAVSVINLAKQKQQAISIVVENAHLMSLQLIHELCQLAEVAKKTNYQINVLMLGLPQAGITVANNRGLFYKKLSVLSAQTGQLLSLNAKLFKPRSLLFEFTPKKKLILTVSAITVMLLIVLAFVVQSDFAQLGGVDNDKESNAQLTAKNTFVGKIDAITEIKTKETEILPSASDKIGATSNEIYLALLNQAPSSVKLKEQSKAALPSDILTAISTEITTEPLIQPMENTRDANYREVSVNAVVDITNSSVKNIEIKPLAQHEDSNSTIIESSTMPVQSEQQTNTLQTLNKELASSLAQFEEVNPNYYSQYNEGFVIQIAGFSQKATFNEFIEQQSQNEFYSYFRLLNNEKLLLVTSPVFETKHLAQQALLALPESLLARKPWIKSITAVNNEINGFQRSQ